MLLRIVISNLLSFKDATEFNTFPSTIKNKSHHKGKYKGVEWLKASAIYGANGAGKSNLIAVFQFLKEIISDGNLTYRPETFKLHSESLADKSSKIEVEFIYLNVVYYYELEFRKHDVLKEILWKDSNSLKPTILFNRTSKKSKINLKIESNFIKSEKDRIRISILEEDIINASELVISNKTIRKVFKEVQNAFNWLNNELIVISPYTQYMRLIPKLFFEEKFFSYVQNTISALDTGVQKLVLKETKIDDYFGEDDKKSIEDIKADLDAGKEGDAFMIHTEVGDVVASKKGKNYMITHLQLLHNSKSKNTDTPFEIDEESEGTQRLFDLVPMTYDLINNNKTYIVDEIERSIHPVIIKELFTKLLNYTIKGQIIFSTHESTLLDLSIFRQDEIWFAEKDKEGATAFYPMSDFKPRFDLDIRKGYLNGRFGAIPFLGDLKELKWETL